MGDTCVCICIYILYVAYAIEYLNKKRETKIHWEIRLFNFRMATLKKIFPWRCGTMLDHTIFPSFRLGTGRPGAENSRHKTYLEGWQNPQNQGCVHLNWDKGKRCHHVSANNLLALSTSWGRKCYAKTFDGFGPFSYVLSDLLVSTQYKRHKQFKLMMILNLDMMIWPWRKKVILWYGEHYLHGWSHRGGRGMWSSVLMALFLCITYKRIVH